MLSRLVLIALLFALPGGRATSAAEVADPVIVAWVGESPVTAGDVDREIARHRRDEQILEAASNTPRIRKAALEQVIRRRLALATLVERGEAISDLALQTELDRQRAYHAERGRSFEELLARQATTLQSAAAELRWSRSWIPYRDRELTEEKLRAFFASQRWRFDGTSRRVSQILLRPEERPDGARESPASGDLEATLERAGRLRDEIVTGKASFGDVAKRESIAPSSARGGDIGLIPYDGVVHQRLAEAIFATPLGEVSGPIVTPHGVHLLTVTDERPGTREFTECRREVRQAAELDLFLSLAESQRDEVPIVYP